MKTEVWSAQIHVVSARMGSNRVFFIIKTPLAYVIYTTSVFPNKLHLIFFFL